MENFADYILSEEDLASKMEIVYYLAKKTKIFYDKSVIFKTEILRMFLNYSKIEVDPNTILTANLLCNCKKIDNAQDIDKIHSYAKEGAEYLREMGFSKRFSKICEEINRYSDSNPRERESDILELVDQFGGMLLDRPERIGFSPEEAIVLLEHRNLKDTYNRYLITFLDFVKFMEDLTVTDVVTMSVFRKLVKIHNETEDLAKFIQTVIYDFEPEVDKLMLKYMEIQKDQMFKETKNSNRPLFSEETTKKILSHINNEAVANNDIK